METPTLTREHLLKLCGGNEPHRADGWQQDWLPPGTRPLMFGEQERLDDERLDVKLWTRIPRNNPDVRGCGELDKHIRTKRPPESATFKHPQWGTKREFTASTPAQAQNKCPKCGEDWSCHGDSSNTCTYSPPQAEPPMPSAGDACCQLCNGPMPCSCKPQAEPTAQTEEKTLAQTIAEIIMVDSDEFDGSIHAYLIDGFAMSGKRDYAEQHRLADLACEKIAQAAIAFTQSSRAQTAGEVLYRETSKDFPSAQQYPWEMIGDLAKEKWEARAQAAIAFSLSSRMEPEKINTRCPACNSQTLVIGSGGLLVCSLIGCPNPTLINGLPRMEQPSGGEMPSVEELLQIYDDVYGQIGFSGEESSARRLEGISAVREACMRAKAPVVSPGWESIIAVEITPELREFARQGIIIDSVMQARGHDEWELGQIAARRIVTRLRQTIADLRKENASIAAEKEQAINREAEAIGALTRMEESNKENYATYDEAMKRLESDRAELRKENAELHEALRVAKSGHESADVRVMQVEADLTAAREALRKAEAKVEWFNSQFCDTHKPENDESWTQYGCPVCEAGKQNAEAVRLVNELRKAEEERDAAKAQHAMAEMEVRDVVKLNNALREELAPLKASSGWIPLSERRPTRADADDLERVLWRLKGKVCEPAPFDIRRSSSEWFWHPMSPLSTPPPSPGLLAPTQIIIPPSPEDVERVPLEACDVPPGSAFRWPEWDQHSWKIAYEIEGDTIYFHHGPNDTEKSSRGSLRELFKEGAFIKRPGEDWQPCSKPARKAKGEQP